MNRQIALNRRKKFMRIPSVFQGKACRCGTKIADEYVKEIGIDLETKQFVLRFACPDCGLNGKLRFHMAVGQGVEDLCAEIVKGQGTIEAGEDMENKKANSMSKEEVFATHFDQNRIGCLFIPDWTEESIREFESELLND